MAHQRARIEAGAGVVDVFDVEGTAGSVAIGLRVVLDDLGIPAEDIGHRDLVLTPDQARQVAAALIAAAHGRGTRTRVTA